MSGNDFFDTEYRYRNSTGAQQAPISQYRLSHNGVYQCRAKHSFLLFMGDSRNGDRNDYFYYSGQRLHHEYLLSEEARHEDRSILVADHKDTARDDHSCNDGHLADDLRGDHKHLDVFRASARL